MTIVARRNGCAAPAESRRPGGLRMRIWSACGAPLIQWAAKEGGHRWPGAARVKTRRKREALEKRLGPPVPAPDATSLIQRFFESLAIARRP